jgi:hypothetical protein
MRLCGVPGLRAHRRPAAALRSPASGAGSVRRTQASPPGPLAAPTRCAWGSAARERRTQPPARQMLLSRSAKGGYAAVWGCYMQVLLTGLPLASPEALREGPGCMLRQTCLLPRGSSLCRPFVQGCADCAAALLAPRPGFLVFAAPCICSTLTGAAQGACRLPCSAGTENVYLHALPVMFKPRTGRSLHGRIPRACRGCATRHISSPHLVLSRRARAELGRERMPVLRRQAVAGEPRSETGAHGQRGRARGDGAARAAQLGLQARPLLLRARQQQRRHLQVLRARRKPSGPA